MTQVHVNKYRENINSVYMSLIHRTYDLLSVFKKKIKMIQNTFQSCNETYGVMNSLKGQTLNTIWQLLARNNNTAKNHYICTLYVYM